jgi:hypothetical protein
MTTERDRRLENSVLVQLAYQVLSQLPANLSDARRVLELSGDLFEYGARLSAAEQARPGRFS